MPPASLDALLKIVDDAAPGLSGGFDRAALERFGATLAGLVSDPSFDSYEKAGAGEESLHLLHEHPLGPSLYLVSDGQGTRSPPHEHLTWALIVGLSGVERNTFYRPMPGSSRQVRQAEERDIGPGDIAVLEPSAIHSTLVVGSTPTFHLHLYGRPLRSLPSFAVRVFSALS